MPGSMAIAFTRGSRARHSVRRMVRQRTPLAWLSESKHWNKVSLSSPVQCHRKAWVDLEISHEVVSANPSKTRSAVGWPERESRSGRFLELDNDGDAASGNAPVKPNE